jgi:signal transduction histidine kinase/ActR/RegA family two-component response regulator
MTQGHAELVRFIRRTFGAATVAILAIAAILIALLFDQSSARDTRPIDRLIGLAAILALAIVLGALFVLRRRISAQAQEMASGATALDLRNAQLIDQADRMERQQLLLERQATELQDALAKLETQKTDLQIRSAELEKIVAALQISEGRFRSLVDSIHDVVFTVGPDKRYTGLFGGGARDERGLKGYIGQTAVEILGPEVGQSHAVAFDRAFGGDPVTYDWSLPVGTDVRHFTTTMSPLRGPHGEITGVVGINRECTDQVKRDTALAEARDQLRQAQRLDALGQLAGGIAHDFNNLLTVIMTYASILLEDATPGSDEQRSVEQIKGASERAAALTRQLLAFSRRQVLQPRAVDLNETVGEVEKMLRRLLAANIDVEINLDAGLGLVMADPGQIEQVLINLAINARDAMPDGGRLSMSTANVDLDGSYLDVDARALTGPYVRITVADTGVGMSPDVVSKVFDPFFTTKDVGKGTGLGLATVHGIVEQSGGRVWVYSEPGRGSTFKIYLPRIATVPEAVAPPPTTDLGGSETVLLIDDNEELRRVVRRMLERAGYQVHEAANGVAALAHLDRGAHVDLVVSDVMMPELGGRAVVDAVRQRHKSVKLLLMSGYNYDTALRGMAQRGDVAFIEKPFTADKLLRKLREVLGPATDRGAA